MIQKTIVEAPLTVPGRGTRTVKLIPAQLACEWLSRDNPKLAIAINGNLFDFLKHPVDLSQYQKPKSKVVEAAITEIPVMEAGSNLQRFDRDGVELVIDRVTGETWATQTGYARMSGLIQQAINYRTTTYKGSDLKTAEVLTATGFKTHKLIPANLCFKWAIKDNPELAEAMGAAGATIYMHQLAGFKVSSDVIAKPEPTSTPAPQAPQLSPAERAKLAIDLTKTLKLIGIDTTNPRFKQSVQDFYGDLLGFKQTALPASDTEKWCGVAERAEQLGYPVALVVKHRSQLGRWVASRVNGWIKEDRLCNGTQRPINLYRVTPELDGAIAAYFAQM